MAILVIPSVLKHGPTIEVDRSSGVQSNMALMLQFGVFVFKENGFKFVLILREFGLTCILRPNPLQMTFGLYTFSLIDRQLQILVTRIEKGVLQILDC